MDGYSTEQASKIYGYSEQTIRNWCREFADFLSPTATPKRGKARRLTEDDMRVLSLVATMKSEAAEFSDIRTALQIGQRGVAPADSPEAVEQRLTESTQKQLALQIQDMQRQLLEKDRALADLRQQLEEATRDRYLLEFTQAELSRTKEELAGLRQQISDLQYRLGRAERDD